MKYYKLENGEYLDLESLELNNFLKLLDNLNSCNNIENNTIEFHKSKGLYANEFIKENKHLINHYRFENDRRNSAIPMLNLLYIDARI